MPRRACALAPWSPVMVLTSFIVLLVAMTLFAGMMWWFLR
jgi:hypothetical protein